MERSLGNNKLSLGVVTWYEIGIDIVTSLFIVCWLELDTTVIIGEDVGESIRRDEKKFCGIIK